MKALIQRVSQASVSIANKIYSQIDQGMLILLGISKDDNESKIDWLVHKIMGLRIFSDSDGRMNIETVSGSLGRITMKTGADIIMQGLENGATELYYNGSKVAETTATGITGAVWG